MLRGKNGNTAATGTQQLVDQKLNVGALAYSTWGELQQVFFLQHVVRPSKSPELHLQLQAKYPKFCPKFKNLANYDKASNDLR